MNVPSMSTDLRLRFHKVGSVLAPPITTGICILAGLELLYIAFFTIAVTFPASLYSRRLYVYSEDPMSPGRQDVTVELLENSSNVVVYNSRSGSQVIGFYKVVTRPQWQFLTALKSSIANSNLAISQLDNSEGTFLTIRFPGKGYRDQRRFIHDALEHLETYTQTIAQDIPGLEIELASLEDMQSLTGLLGLTITGTMKQEPIPEREEPIHPDHRFSEIDLEDSPESQETIYSEVVEEEQPLGPDESGEVEPGFYEEPLPAKAEKTDHLTRVIFVDGNNVIGHVPDKEALLLEADARVLQEQGHATKAKERYTEAKRRRKEWNATILDDLIDQLAAEGFDRIRVIVSDTLRYNRKLVDKDYLKALIDKGVVEETEVGAKDADWYIINMAIKYSKDSDGHPVPILSNDLFRDWKEQYPEKCDSINQLRVGYRWDAHSKCFFFDEFPQLPSARSSLPVEDELIKISDAVSESWAISNNQSPLKSPAKRVPKQSRSSRRKAPNHKGPSLDNHVGRKVLKKEGTISTDETGSRQTEEPTEKSKKENSEKTLNDKDNDVVLATLKESYEKILETMEIVKDDPKAGPITYTGRRIFGRRVVKDLLSVLEMIEQLKGVQDDTKEELTDCHTYIVDHLGIAIEDNADPDELWKHIPLAVKMAGTILNNLVPTTKQPQRHKRGTAQPA